MSFSKSDGSLRSPEQVRFFAQHYHPLKGLCYAPAGALLLLGILGSLLIRPAWLAGGGAVLLCLAVLVLSVPWTWYMHRRYEAAYGRVRQTQGGGGPLGAWTPSFWMFGPLLLFGFCWLAVAMLYIPQHTPLEDNHYFVIMPGWLLLLGALSAPAARLRWVYGASGTVLIVGTLLPLFTENVVLVQTLNYSLLGAVVAGVGLYNHHLLVNTLGPLTAEEGTANE